MSSPSAPGSSGLVPLPLGIVVAGKYRIEEILGQGGMGLVVRATHLQLGEPVALKFLHVDLAQDARHVERFLREARAQVRIKSEHIARVFDVGTLSDGEPFLVMELLVGDDLHEVSRRRGPLPVAEAVDYVVQACHAVSDAHRHGIVHRDLKPSNLFLTRGDDGAPFVKVLDFGISRTIDGSDQELTVTGDVMGSTPYMSPEQIRDPRRVDGRADIWALGTILYQLLTCAWPFAASSSAATVARIIADPAPPLRATRPDVSPELEAVVLRCLEKSPAHRFQRAEDLASALASALLPGSPRPEIAADPSSAPDLGAPSTGSGAPSPLLWAAGASETAGETTATGSSITGPQPAPRTSRLALAVGALLTVAVAAVAVAVARPWPRPVASTAAPGASAPPPAPPPPSSPGLAPPGAPVPEPSASTRTGSPADSAPPAPSAAPALPRPPAPAAGQPTPRPNPKPAGGAGPRRMPTAAPAAEPTVPRYGQD